MGRTRKPLIEKSTNLIIKIDNETIFAICDKYGIKYNPEMNILDNDVLKQVSEQIIKTLKKEL